jgi:prolipoprotein diacylglyceryltransferase
VAILLTALLRLRKTERYDGFLITVFGAWYGVQRIIEDFLREDTRHFGLTGSQITAILTVLLCLWHLSMVRRTPKWGRWDNGGEPHTMAEPLDEPVEHVEPAEPVDPAIAPREEY